MEPITFRTLAQNVVLLSFVATLAGLFALAAVYGYYADKRDAAKALLEEKDTAASPLPRRGLWEGRALGGGVGAGVAARFCIRPVQRAALRPPAHLGEPLAHVALQRLRPAAPRPARCMVCFFNILVIIAAEAMCHWLKYPMGYCRAAETRASCLAKTLLYDEVWVAVVGGETKQACSWTLGPLDPDNKPCELDVQEAGAVNPRTLFLELVVVLLTLPALKFHNWLFFTYVSAPRKSTRKVAPAGACPERGAARRRCGASGATCGWRATARTSMGWRRSRWCIGARATPSCRRCAPWFGGSGSGPRARGPRPHAPGPVDAPGPEDHPGGVQQQVGRAAHALEELDDARPGALRAAGAPAPEREPGPGGARRLEDRGGRRRHGVRLVLLYYGATT